MFAFGATSFEEVQVFPVGVVHAGLVTLTNPYAAGFAAISFMNANVLNGMTLRPRLRDRLAQRQIEEAGERRDRCHCLRTEGLQFRRLSGVGHPLDDDVLRAGGLQLAGGRGEIERRLPHRSLHLRLRDLAGCV